jgi:hypothetical protein
VHDVSLEVESCKHSETAQRSYQQAISDFYHPPLPSPVIEFDPEASSFFYIDASTWTIHLNTAGVPLHFDGELAEPYLRSVSHHEIMHYLVCPFDGITNGMMFARARRHVTDKAAMFVCNLFADFVVESKLLKKYPRLTHDRIVASLHEASIRVSKTSDVWNLIAASFRAMWGFPIPAIVEMNDETYTAGEAIVEVAKKYIDKERMWPKACEEIAKLLSEWIEDENQFEWSTSGLDGMGEDEEGESRDIPLPADVDALMGDPTQIRNGDMARRCQTTRQTQLSEGDLERLAEEVERRGGNLDDLQGVLLLAGVGSPTDKWIHFWYRAKAKGLIRFDVHTKRVSGSVPLSQQTWRIGDPIEELDIVQSLQAFPVLIPNLSTRRWISTDSYGTVPSTSLPDLLLVIDSSGSMTWSMTRRRVSGPYHTALVSAFAALEYARSANSRVSVINFSSGVRTSEWSHDRSQAERILLSYQGSGTVSPNKSIKELCDRAETNVLILMITDAEITNWESLVRLVKKLVLKGHRYFMFHIGGGSTTADEQAAEEIGAAGGTLIPIRSIRDLPGLVIKEVKRAYTAQSK